MKYNDNLLHDVENNSIKQNSVPTVMMNLCFIASFFGASVMFFTDRTILMWVYIAVIGSMCITVPLLKRGHISVDAACLIPISILCFVHIPVSWYEFNGLLGSTPLISVLYTTVVTLTYYQQIQKFILSAFVALIIVLIISWFAKFYSSQNAELAVSVAVAYVAVIILNIKIIEDIKQKNIHLTQKIRDLSFQDDLTDLLNRRAFPDRIRQIQEASFESTVDFAIVTIDVDKLKYINDHYGHPIGDSVIKNVGRTIKDSIRSTDTGFRIGGDEFILLLDTHSSEIAYAICQDIKTRLLAKQGYSFSLSLSIGIAFYSEVANLENLFELSDQRMYSEKQSKDHDMI